MQRKEFVLEEKYLKYYETEEMFVHAWLLGFVSQSPVNLRLSVGCREELLSSSIVRKLTALV